MSAPKHTPEPWSIGAPPPNGEHIIGTDRGMMVAVTATGHLVDSLANAKRIVACINACAGMDDPAAEIAKLREQAAELRWLAAWLLDAYHSDDGMPEAKVIARECREALAKLDGKP